jgi:uncharacterized protein (DUF1778 family)
MSKKTKVIHCRVTEDEHQIIADAAQKVGLSITQFVVATALARTLELAD